MSNFHEHWIGRAAILIGVVAAEREFIRRFDRGRVWSVFYAAVPIAGGLLGFMAWEIFRSETAPSNLLSQMNIYTGSGAILATTWVGARVWMKFRWASHALRRCRAAPIEFAKDSSVCQLRDQATMERCLEVLESAHHVKYIPARAHARAKDLDPAFEDWIERDEDSLEDDLYFIVPGRALLRHRGAEETGYMYCEPRNARVVLILALGDDKHGPVAYTITPHRFGDGLIQTLRQAKSKTYPNP